MLYTSVRSSEGYVKSTNSLKVSSENLSASYNDGLLTL
jgi:hypothetical protein